MYLVHYLYEAQDDLVRISGMISMALQLLLLIGHQFILTPNTALTLNSAVRLMVIAMVLRVPLDYF